MENKTPAQSTILTRASALRKNESEPMTETSKVNGPTQGQTPEELAVATAVQHHVASYQRVCNEREELQRLVNRQEQILTVNKIEVESLRAELGVAQSRIASYQAERDDAVANLGVYQTLFISFMAQMRAFGIEHAPLVKEKQETHLPPHNE